MALSPDFLDELRTRIAVSDIVGRQVKLTKKGREYSGLCPFHKEKSPSFTVNDEKGFYHCFGCGAHGSAIDFLMNNDGLSFREAVERLANQAGLEVPRDTVEQQQRSDKRKTLVEVMEAACRFFEKSLRMPDGRVGMDYINGRGLSEATIKRFRLGYSPDSRGALKSALARDGIDEALMIEAGLVIKPDDGRPAYDRFRGRVMFPITDRTGKVIAFGGRILGDGKPKYLNSPETPIFHKGNVLYGLAQARESAHKRDAIIVTEGYMDVIALSQAGFEHAVAPLGTALTEDQIALLWKITRKPLLCFDGDSAGQRAAARAAERTLGLLKPGYSMEFVTVPAGEDPDSLIKAEGPKAMQTILDQAIPLSEMIWRMETQDHPLVTPEDRAWLEDRLKAHAFCIQDENVRSHFLQGFKDRLWETFRKKRQVTREFTPFKKAVKTTQLEPASGAETKIEFGRTREKIFIATLISHPELYDEIGEHIGLMHFSLPELDKLRQEALKTLDGNPGLDSSALEFHLRQSGYSATLEALLNQEVYKHAYFVRSDVDTAEALKGWMHVFRLYGREEMKADLQVATQRLAKEMTQDNFDRMVAIQKLMGMVDGDDFIGVDFDEDLD